jgi:hypothetical protein
VRGKRRDAPAASAIVAIRARKAGSISAYEPVQEHDSSGHCEYPALALADLPNNKEICMKLSMYQASVTAFTRQLNNLVAILDKAAAHADAKKIDPKVLINSRLFPDMFSLLRQIQIATDTARGGAARLAGVEVPAQEDNETTFPELVARIRKTVSYLETLKAEQFEGSEDRTVTWQTRSSTKTMQGLPYLQNHLLPNLYFHITTAYDILRHSGVELGKQDFLGKP